MKKKKLAIVGRGTAGCLSFLHYNYYNGKEFDVEIEWIYDSNIPSSPVGEGTDLRIPVELGVKAKFRTDDLLEIGGTPKLGIQKEDWNGTGSFLNPFPIGSNGIHMDAGRLQEWVFKNFGSDVQTTDRNVANADDVDADYVMMATGNPRDADPDVFYHSDYIPVNAAYVTQCDWPHGYPTFVYTLTIARPWGWVFGIPLQGRCSIGYLYNRNITDIETIKHDVQEVFERYNLTPTEKTNSIHFNNYYRTEPIDGRVAYNGNSCFFLEPLEATSLSCAYLIDTLAWHRWFGGSSSEDVNKMFCDKMEQVEGIICSHYWAGSKYKNEFWDMAQAKGTAFMKRILNNPEYKNWLQLCATDVSQASGEVEFGTWDKGIWNINIKGLGLENKILELC